MLVKVYFNLHARKFSLLAAEGCDRGLVVAHAERLHLEDPRCLVSLAGQARVRRNRRKTVHAFIKGRLVGACGLRAASADRHAPDCGPVEAQMIQRFVEAAVPFSYDPYRHEGFTSTQGEPRVIGAAAEMLLCLQRRNLAMRAAFKTSAKVAAVPAIAA